MMHKSNHNVALYQASGYKDQEYKVFGNGKVLKIATICTQVTTKQKFPIQPFIPSLGMYTSVMSHWCI